MNHEGMKNLSRRSFLGLAGAGAAFAVSGYGLFNHFQLGRTTGPSRIFTGYRVGEPHDNKNAGFAILTPQGRQRFQLDNEIHSIIHSPDRDLYIFVGKLDLYSYYRYGDGPIERITAEIGNYFYGHARIDEKRGLAYFSQARITETRSEFERREEPGFIYVYALPDFKFVKKFSSFGSDPHDLAIVGNELIVCNGGANSNVACIDLDSHTLIRSHEIHQEHLSLRHIEQVDEDNFVVIPLTRDINRTCPPYAFNRKEGFRAFPMPYLLEMTMFRHQVLSGLCHDGYFYGTCPAMDSLAIWTPSGEFVGGVEIPAASSVAYSASLGGVVVGSGDPSQHGRLVRIKDKKIEHEILPWGLNMMGSHSLIIEG